MRAPYGLLLCEAEATPGPVAELFPCVRRFLKVGLHPGASSELVEDVELPFFLDRRLPSKSRPSSSTHLPFLDLALAQALLCRCL